MIRRAVVAGALLLTFMVVVPVGAGAAVSHSSSRASGVKPMVTGTGVTKCPVIDAVIKFSPALFTSGASGTETVTIKSAGKPCGGGTPVPHEYTFKATATITGTDVNTCSDFFATAPPGTVSAAGTFTGTIKYPGITTSATSFSSVVSTDSTLTAPVKFSISPLTVTGSYPTATGLLKMKSESSETVAALVASCGSTAGLSKITMKNGAGGGLF